MSLRNCRNSESRFQSTLPAGEATPWAHLLTNRYQFQSTLPAGEATRGLKLTVSNVGLFQSTLPAGEATSVPKETLQALLISIHASRGGSDNHITDPGHLQPGFQSTLPAGEATLGGLTQTSIHWSFQSTLPAGEATKRCRPLTPKRLISIHASRGGSDL